MLFAREPVDHVGLISLSNQKGQEIPVWKQQSISHKHTTFPTQSSGCKETARVDVKSLKIQNNKGLMKMTLILIELPFLLKCQLSRYSINFVYMEISLQFVNKINGVQTFKFWRNTVHSAFFLIHV